MIKNAEFKKASPPGIRGKNVACGIGYNTCIVHWAI